MAYFDRGVKTKRRKTRAMVIMNAPINKLQTQPQENTLRLHYKDQSGAI